ncbi:PREDICTED: uncharacterized protein LOC107351699 isoform X2 [Paramuricea clavata]|uniref:PREDICTED: uncharacterized protein LOC107351699 isoform X2 n=1 Tax=Paramuricea clavata TaxID=317549 RepID=A0A6S7KJ76_PARCT|nr:PREDICTED: uncharacterized protein LOC107351699 isoform X2 [Paramuricea clavata]
MATVLGVGRISLKTRIFTPQLFKLVPVVQGRCVSDKSSGPSQKASNKTAKQESSTEQASYKVPEYYSHTIDTYADMEIEMASHRQSQPDPRVPYHHHYPWEKSS